VQWHLPLELLRAMVLVESSGRWAATRYENGWRYPDFRYSSLFAS
jgi:hypothetical protein